MITTRTIVTVALKHVGDHVWRVQRVDTGKVLGTVTGSGRKWRAAASMRAFLGNGPADGEPPGDWVPRALYAPGMASHGHHYLPGVHGSQRLAVAALQRWLDEQHAPAMGHGPHSDVQVRKPRR